MKKRYIVMIVILFVSIIVVTLYQTFAIDVNSNNSTSDITDIGYDFDINGNGTKSVTVKNGTTKYFDLRIVNTNDGTIKYGIAYNNSNMSGVTIKGSSSSSNPVTGLIESSDDGIYVGLEITNNSGSDKTVTFMIVTGYENGGDLIVPSGYTLVS